MSDCPGCPKSDPVPLNAKPEATVLGWRAWWDDADGEIQTTDSTQTELEQLPEEGFQGLMLYYTNGTKRIISGSTWYYFANHPHGMIYGQGEEKPAKKRYPGLFKVCRGRWIPDERYAALNAEMMASTYGDV